MIDAFQAYHQEYTHKNIDNSFLRRVMMPHFKTPFSQAPVALFAHLDPAGNYESADVLDAFLKVAM